MGAAESLETRFGGGKFVSDHPKEGDEIRTVYYDQNGYTRPEKEKPSGVPAYVLQTGPNAYTVFVEGHTEGKANYIKDPTVFQELKGQFDLETKFHGKILPLGCSVPKIGNKLEIIVYDDEGYLVVHEEEAKEGTYDLCQKLQEGMTKVEFVAMQSADSLKIFLDKSHLVEGRQGSVERRMNDFIPDPDVKLAVKAVFRQAAEAVLRQAALRKRRERAKLAAGVTAGLVLGGLAAKKVLRQKKGETQLERIFKGSLVPLACEVADDVTFIYYNREGYSKIRMDRNDPDRSWCAAFQKAYNVQQKYMDKGRLLRQGQRTYLVFIENETDEKYGDFVPDRDIYQLVQSAYSIEEQFGPGLHIATGDDCHQDDDLLRFVVYDDQGYNDFLFQCATFFSANPKTKGKILFTTDKDHYLVAFIDRDLVDSDFAKNEVDKFWKTPNAKLKPAIKKWL